MIYTVTFNPAIDYIVYMKELEKGSINRSERETAFFGGKGINVSFILKELGHESTALGFVAGFTGKALEQGIENKGLHADFVRLENGITRINVKIRSGEETDINAQGPDIKQGDIDRLLKSSTGLKRETSSFLREAFPKRCPPIYTKE